MANSGRNVLVIGAGAAGCFAAIAAARAGSRVRLLEKTDRIGTKILISGGGRCNVAHDGPLEQVLEAFRTNERRFIRPACYAMTNTQIMSFFDRAGIELMTRPDGRVFPSLGTAKDVVNVIARTMHEAGVDVYLETPVLGLVATDGRVIGAATPNGEVLADATVVTVGGSSYPKTGSTGDGYGWLSSLGHSIIPIKAALAPIELVFESQGFPPGVALRNVTLKARSSGKELDRWSGDLLFTHRGVSGPTVLGVSRKVAESTAATALTVDLAPEQTVDGLVAFIQEWRTANPKKDLAGLAAVFVPAALADHVLNACGVSGRAARLSDKAVSQLANGLKSWRLGLVKEVVLERGEVVAGGVSLDEVDPKTMASRVVGGLYLAGEVLDVAGPVGGYNLQAAFATGHLAGLSAAAPETQGPKLSSTKL